ncbi:MAG TPA: ATP-binding protein [Methylomirabilota bacterium]|nr:ATP-binding protein [Methylomirabilota bacterium]
MSLRPSAIPLLITAALNLAIAVYVYRRNPRGRPHLALAALGSLAALWATGVALGHYSVPFSVSFVRFTLGVASLAPLSTLILAEVFPPARPIHRSLPIIVFTTPALAFCVLAVTTPLLVRSVSAGASGISIEYGLLHPAYAIYMLACFGSSIWVLADKYRTVIGVLRIQTGYLLLALAVPIAFGTLTNLIVPVIFGTSILSKFGPLFSLVMIAMIAHAIIRHRLMDIRVKVRRGAVYLAAVLVAGLALLTLMVASNTLFHDEHQVPVREILLALFVAVLFAPLKGQIQRAFDRYLYREPYDYQRTIRETSRVLSTTIDLSALLAHFAHTVGATLRPEGLAIYLLDDEEGRFERAHLLGHGGFPDQAALSVPLLIELDRQRRLLFRDEVGRDSGGLDPAAALEGFARLGSEVLVPLIEGDRLIGFLAVGPKRSGDPFFSDDADLLATLANQSAVAVRNAQVHHQVVLVNEHIQRILATIDSGVAAVGARGQITLFNRAAEALAGGTAAALRGRPVGHLPAPLARLLEATAADGESRSPVEIALPTASGQLIPLICSTSPLIGAAGARLGAVAVFSDLSRVKELEQEKRRAERLASLEAIASGMVHEIRNPLVSLKAFAQLLPSRFGEPEFRETFTRVADREISRIDELLGRFRTLSSPQTQPMVPLDIADPIGATLELLGPDLSARGVRLRRVGEGPYRLISGNASKLEQLFHNLCLNALEAMSEGGELTVRVADLREAGGNLLLVEISDTGPGIPPDLIDKIFNPFVTTKARGSGLGLAICSSIADAHRATLRARNHLDRPGCSFTVEFPVTSERPASIRT